MAGWRGRSGQMGAGSAGGVGGRLSAEGGMRSGLGGGEVWCLGYSANCKPLNVRRSVFNASALNQGRSQMVHLLSVTMLLGEKTKRQSVVCEWLGDATEAVCKCKAVYKCQRESGCQCSGGPDNVAVLDR